MSAQFSSFDRRTFLTALSALGAGVALSACAGPGSKGSATTNAPATGAGTGPATGTVSFAHWRAEDKAAFDSLIAEFVKANPEVKVNQDISPSNDYQSTALQKIRGGNIGDAFVAFRGAQFVNMVKAGIYTDLSAAPVKDKLQPALLAAGQDGGKTYGLPYQLVFNMPVFNKDAFAKAGLTEAPKDWDGFLAACEKLKGAGYIPIAWPGGEAGNAGQLFNSMMMNAMPADDGCAQIEAGKLKVTDDWFLDVLRKYKQLAPYFQPNSVGTAVEPAQQLFASGKAAMLATGSFHVAAVRKLGGAFPVDLIAPITTSADKAKYVGVYNATFILGVNSASKNQAAAMKWLEFLTDPVNAAKYADATVQHLTVKGVTYANKDLMALQPWLEKKTLLAPRFQFTNLDIRNAAEGACVKVVGGTAPEQAAADAQKVIDQKRG